MELLTHIRAVRGSDRGNAAVTRRASGSCSCGGKLLAATRLLLAAAVMFVAPARAHAQQAAPQEFQIKAVFLFNFLQFVEWPSAAFADVNEPIRIGVLGEDPFGSALDEAVHNETIRNRTLVIQRSRRLEDLQNCHLIYISRSERAHVDEILAGINRDPVLTVGDIDGFARRGGVINFYLEGKRVRFEFNAAAAQQRGLKMSSQLLSLGKIVGPNPAAGG